MMTFEFFARELKLRAWQRGLKRVEYAVVRTISRRVLAPPFLAAFHRELMMILRPNTIYQIGS